jgi:hypothetical protein
MSKLKMAKDLFKSKTTSKPNSRIGKAVAAGVKAAAQKKKGMITRTLPTVTVTAKKTNK